MRHIALRGESFETDEIAVASAHLSLHCSKCAGVNARKEYKRFFDVLAHDIMDFKVRFLGIDASMALYMVVPELRARAVLISLAALFPWRKGDDPYARSDSLGLFVIGPLVGIS